jgi:hypothetical protein
MKYKDKVIWEELQARFLSDAKWNFSNISDLKAIKDSTGKSQL